MMTHWNCFVDTKVFDPLACGLADPHSQIRTPGTKKWRYSIRLSYFFLRCARGIHFIWTSVLQIDPKEAVNLLSGVKSLNNG